MPKYAPLMIVTIFFAFCFVLLFVLNFKTYNNLLQESSEKILSKIEISKKLFEVCQSQPCKHGGMCRLNESYSYNCICINNFTGSDCQFEPGSLLLRKY
jgi:hypothetical protein